MKDLEGASAQGGACVNGGTVGEVGVGIGEGNACHFLFDHAADGGDHAFCLRGGVGEIVEVVEGEVHFIHFLFRLGACAVDDAAGDVGGEEGSIEFQECGEGGDAELADFEDVVAGMEMVVEFFLRPVHGETADKAVLIHDPVEVVEPPLAVGEEEGDFLILLRG